MMPTCPVNISDTIFYKKMNDSGYIHPQHLIKRHKTVDDESVIWWYPGQSDESDGRQVKIDCVGNGLVSTTDAYVIGSGQHYLIVLADRHGWTHPVIRNHCATYAKAPGCHHHHHHQPHHHQEAGQNQGHSQKGRETGLDLDTERYQRDPQQAQKGLQPDQQLPRRQSSVTVNPRCPHNGFNVILPDVFKGDYEPLRSGTSTTSASDTPSDQEPQQSWDVRHRPGDGTTANTWMVASIIRSILAHSLTATVQLVAYGYGSALALELLNGWDDSVDDPILTKTSGRRCPSRLMGAVIFQAVHLPDYRPQSVCRPIHFIRSADDDLKAAEWDRWQIILGPLMDQTYYPRTSRSFVLQLSPNSRDRRKARLAIHHTIEALRKQLRRGDICTHHQCIPELSINGVCISSSSSSSTSIFQSTSSLSPPIIRGDDHGRSYRSFDALSPPSRSFDALSPPSPTINNTNCNNSRRSSSPLILNLRTVDIHYPRLQQAHGRHRPLHAGDRGGGVNRGGGLRSAGSAGARYCAAPSVSVCATVPGYLWSTGRAGGSFSSSSSNGTGWESSHRIRAQSEDPKGLRYKLLSPEIHCLPLRSDVPHFLEYILYPEFRPRPSSHLPASLCRLK